MSIHRLAEELKAAFETLSPSLRKSMHPGVAGKVIAVSPDDDPWVDVEVPDEPAESEEPGDPWILPRVPVNALAAGDGFGIYVVPEVGSEVSISFKDWDITRPRLDGAEFLQNRTPIGGRVGSFTMCDRNGQRITLRPDTGEFILRSYNVSDQCAGARSESTTGGKSVEVQGPLSERIAGHAEKTFEGNLTETIEGDLTRSVGGGAVEEYTDYEDGGRYFQHGLIVNGAQRIKIKGGRETRIGGDDQTVVLGASRDAIAGGKEIIVGGRLQIMAAGMMPDGTIPTNPDEFVGCEVGSAPPSFTCWGGKFIPGVSAPMVNGTLLVTAMTAYTSAMTAAFAALAGSFSGPNPVIGSALALALGTFATAQGLAVSALITALTGSCSIRQFFAVP